MKQKVDLSELQEQHLDAMIGLAFDLDDAEEALRLSSEPDPALTPQEEEQAEAIFQTVLARLDEREKAVRQQRRRETMKRWIPRVIEVAACLALVLAIAMPVAVANSSAFRSRVLRLLFEPDVEQGAMYIRLMEDPDAAFDVPEEWDGEYFPSYLPEGYSVSLIDTILSTVVFRSDTNPDIDVYIVFSEYGADTVEYSGTDNATIYNVDINGSTAHVIDGYTGSIHSVSVKWSGEDKWFIVDTYGLESAEALKIAESVKRIIKSSTKCRPQRPGDRQIESKNNFKMLSQKPPHSFS